MRMELIASRLTNSSTLAEGSNPSKAPLVALIAINKIPMTTGKLRTAISTLLLFALLEMPDIRLKEAEKPHDVKNNVHMNKGKSPTGLSMKIAKSTNPIIERRKHRREL